MRERGRVADTRGLTRRSSGDGEERPLRIEAHPGRIRPEIDDRHLNKLVLQLDDERVRRRTSSLKKRFLALPKGVAREPVE